MPTPSPIRKSGSAGRKRSTSKKLFNQALGCLNPREKDILFKRRLYEKSITLDDLSKSYAISKERVRQIELNSIRKIRKAVEVLQ